MLKVEWKAGLKVVKLVEMLVVSLEAMKAPMTVYSLVDTMAYLLVDTMADLMADLMVLL